MSAWIYLGLAIIAEVIATTALKATDGFSRWLPLLVVVVGYSLAFFFLALSLKQIPLGVAYAIWAGLGIVLIGLIGWLLYGQQLDLAALIGMGLILLGVVVINVFSKTAA